MNTTPVTMWEVLGEYVQEAYDVQANARALLVGVKVSLLPNMADAAGEIGDVRLDAEHGLVFAVHLVNEDGSLCEERTWQPSKRLGIDTTPLEGIGHLDGRELANIMERRLEQDEDL